MFWGCYTKYRRGPSYIFDKESPEEKEAAKKHLAERSLPHEVEQQLRKEELDQINASRPKSRQRKRPNKVNTRKQERGKNLKGGIDWYRYQQFVLKPLLIPFIHQIIEEYGKAYLVQDGAGAHYTWHQKELLEIPGLTVLPWPGNSPDLNMIEPCWYHLKREVSNVPFRQNTKEWYKEQFTRCWEDQDPRRIKKWCRRLLVHIMRVIRAKDGNNFVGQNLRNLTI